MSISNRVLIECTRALCLAIVQSAKLTSKEVKQLGERVEAVLSDANLEADVDAMVNDKQAPNSTTN